MNNLLMTNATTALYETPFGGFDTWEAAAIACERADMDPCDCIKYTGPAATPPALVHAETASYGQPMRLSFAIKCF